MVKVAKRLRRTENLRKSVSGLLSHESEKMVRVVRCRVVDAGTLTQTHRLMRKAASAAVKMVVRRSCLDFTVAA